MSDIRSFFGGDSRSNVSIYIPTISCSHSESDIIRIFAKANFGNVSRVDFVPFENSEKEGFRQAFVHFDSCGPKNIINYKIQKEGSYKFELNYYSEKPTKEYWVLLKNNAPVTETKQNIHQVAHNQKLLEERESLMVQKMEKMEQMMTKMEERSAQMEERESVMAKKITKLEDEMKMMILLNEKFAQTFDVQTANLQTLSNIVCKRNQPETQPNADMAELEKKITELKTEVDDQYWQLISKNESLAVDVSTLYERLWLDVEKLIKKTDKNITDIADCHNRAYKLGIKLRFADEKINRVIDAVQSVLEEQVSDKAVSDLKTDIMRYGEPRRGKMIIEELL